MISLTRLNGQPFALNPDLIERLDVAPETVVTLIDGASYLVAESLEEVIQEVQRFRAAIVSMVNAAADTARHAPAGPPPRALRVVVAEEA